MAENWQQGIRVMNVQHRRKPQVRRSMRHFRWNILIIGAIALCVTEHGLCGEARVAVVNMERVLQEFRKTRGAEAEIERQKQEFVAEMERMKAKLRELEDLFEAAREETHNKTLSEDALEKKLAAAEKKLVDVKEYEQRMHMLAQQRKRELIGQSERMRRVLMDEMRRAVQGYAKEKGLLVVIDLRAGVPGGGARIVYHDETVDITDEVISRLNKEKGGKKGGKP